MSGYKRLVLVPLITALFLTFASCREDFFVSDGSTWGTTYHIVYRSAAPANDSIVAVMRKIDSSLSMFNPLSGVSRINDGTLDVPDALFRDVMDISRRVHTLSGGRFDPTVAPLVDLWGFGPSGPGREPDSQAVAAALASVGLAGCRLDSIGTLVKKSPATRFDFSAVAKGYGVDCVADMLERNGCSDYLVEIGGEVAVAGLNPDGKPWRVQVDAPSDRLHHGLTVLTLGPARQAVASSGNYRNYRVDSAGNRYGHTIDPRTGYPVQTRVLAATVLAPSCGLADALATACMTMEPDSAMAMLERAGLRGLVVTARGDSLAVLSTILQ